MKTPLNVFDLDGTILKTDSLKIFYLFLLRKRPHTSVYFALRFFRIWTSSRLKEGLYILAKELFQKHSKEFLSKMKSQTDEYIIQLLNKSINSEGKTIVISASYDFYVRAFCNELGCEGYGSYKAENGRFINLQGEKKVEFLKNHFPNDKYEYQFSVSDHLSDLNLLREFKDSHLAVRKEGQTILKNVNDL